MTRDVRSSFQAPVRADRSGRGPATSAEPATALPRVPPDGYPPGEERGRAIQRIVDYAATLPVLDDRPPDEILGYGDDGLPS